jgi:hypothetical protein
MSYTTYTPSQAYPSMWDDQTGIPALTTSSIASINVYSGTGTGTNTPGTFITDAGTGPTWTLPSISAIDINSAPLFTTMPGSGTLSVKGRADFDDDITIKGVSLSETLDKINERLAILKPNPDLESRWEKLKELRVQYEQLERECFEKEEIIKILEK